MQGRIVGQISNDYKVETKENTILCKPRGKLKREDILPVVGDIVEIEITEPGKGGVIEEILPRKCYIKRPKLSNLDQVILVLAAKMPKPDLLLLDKQLAYLEYLQIHSIIVFNKIDLEKEKIKELKELYEKIGYPVLLTVAKQKEGMKELRQYLAGKTSAFSGNSGVGKSTLLNNLCGENKTLQGEISNRNQRGKNTTTAVELYSLGQETYIADTPGFSTFSIEEIPYRELDQYFLEFKQYIPKCEYVGCSHIKEENCGIKKAVDSGEIHWNRYQNYVKMREELKKKEEYKW